VVTTESGPDLQALSQRLNRPAASLRAYAELSPAEHAALLSCLDAALAQRRTAIDHALLRLIPWPLRGSVLRWLRR